MQLFEVSCKLDACAAGMKQMHRGWMCSKQWMLTPSALTALRKGPPAMHLTQLLPAVPPAHSPSLGHLPCFYCGFEATLSYETHSQYGVLSDATWS